MKTGWLGYRVCLAEDGEAALRYALAMRPDLVLMDLMMPVLDGFETIRRLKSDPSTAHIPVLAVTALGRPRDWQRAIDSGAADYLTKPFDIDALASKIRRYAGGNEGQYTAADDAQPQAEA